MPTFLAETRADFREDQLIDFERHEIVLAEIVRAPFSLVDYEIVSWVLWCDGQQPVSS
jgi:hypothetical protein